MRHTLAALVLLSAVAALGQNPQDCSQFNKPLGPYKIAPVDPLAKEHAYGNHQFTNTMSGSCTYTGSSGPVRIGCSNNAVASSSSSAPDSGPDSIIPVATSHWPNVRDQQGQNTAQNGGAASATAIGAAAFKSCTFSCSASITISGDSVSFGSDALWENSKIYKNDCPGESLPPVCEPSGQPPGQGYTWNYSSCGWVSQGSSGCGSGGPCSPIVLDTTGSGFVFTDPKKDYVRFDLKGDGKLEKLSWPRHGSGNAWLVLDRDGDGVIKDGTELFGNFTPHSDGGVVGHTAPNGFLALAWYDQAEQGGNVDLMLDKRDPVWNKLRLWIDEHCYLTPDTPCQSRPNELHTLESEGVQSLSLLYQYSNKTDPIGNQYEFYAVVNPEAHDREKDEHGFSCCNLHKQSKDKRLMYDVFLTAAP